MLFSRSLAMARAVARALPHQAKSNAPLVRQQTRQMSGGHPWSYRTGAPPHDKWTIYTTEFMGAFMWWWIFWHLWHDFDHIVGHYPYPNPSEWTNAELGIPPDDE